MVMVMPFRSGSLSGLVPLALIAALAAGAVRAESDSDAANGDSVSEAEIGIVDGPPDIGGEGDGSGEPAWEMDEAVPDSPDAPVANEPGDTGEEEIMVIQPVGDCGDCEVAATGVARGEVEQSSRTPSARSGDNSPAGDDDCYVDGTTIRVAWCINW